MSTYSLSAADRATIAATVSDWIAADPTWTDSDGPIPVSTSIGDALAWRGGDVWAHGVRIASFVADETESARTVTARESLAESFTLLDVIGMMQAHRNHARDTVTASPVWYRYARGLLATPLNLP